MVKTSRYFSYSKYYQKLNEYKTLYLDLIETPPPSFDEVYFIIDSYFAERGEWEGYLEIRVKHYVKKLLKLYIFMITRVSQK